jgi:putative transposon-encoded protein
MYKTKVAYYNNKTSGKVLVPFAWIGKTVRVQLADEVSETDES